MRVTVCIPIAPYHVNVSHRAIASVQAQSAPVTLAAMLDIHGRGPGYIRNQLLSGVQTEFVLFLDADDWLEPTFVEKAISNFDGRRYVYTDWFQDGVIISAPQRAWCQGKPHLITSLIPTQWLKQINGFDSTLPGMEDTDLFERLMEYGYCGKHLAEPLLHYSGDGRRSKEFRKRKDYEEVKKRIRIRHTTMGCCDDNPVNPTELPGEIVQAKALWNGNRREVGRITGFVYPRTGNGRIVEMNRRDALASPHLWQIIEPVKEPEEDNHALAIIGGAMFPKRPAAPAPYDPGLEPAAIPVKVHPDFKKVIRLGRKRERGDPVFIFPRKEYPSYSDIRKLVSLSGFDTCYPDEARDGLYILVSPERVDLPHATGRVIAWQLEYTGDYTHNYDGFTGEIWASDKAWADEHGTKYVLLGSHRELGYEPGGYLWVPGHDYDVTMLGYMVPRRQAIKDALNDLRWPDDYPGHGTDERSHMLNRTRLMLQVHQHEGSYYIAPQRIAIAAAHRMPVVSETIKTPGDLESKIFQCDYPDIPAVVRTNLKGGHGPSGEDLYQFLCIDHSFRKCVEEALG